MSDKDWFHELFRIVAQLRSDKGCPWDRQQTHSSLKRYLFEEAAEVLDAIDDEDDSALEEELGDVLLQIALHAQIAAEETAALPEPSAADDTGAMIDIAQIEGKVRESSLRKVGEIVQNHPEESISILRNWMFNES